MSYVALGLRAGIECRSQDCVGRGTLDCGRLSDSAGLGCTDIPPMEQQMPEAAKQAGEVEDLFQSWLRCRVKTLAEKIPNHMSIWLVSFDE